MAAISSTCRLSSVTKLFVPAGSTNARRALRLCRPCRGQVRSTVALLHDRVEAPGGARMHAGAPVPYAVDGRQADVGGARDVLQAGAGDVLHAAIVLTRNEVRHSFVGARA